MEPKQFNKLENWKNNPMGQEKISHTTHTHKKNLTLVTIQGTDDASAEGIWESCQLKLS